MFIVVCVVLSTGNSTNPTSMTFISLDVTPWEPGYRGQLDTHYWRWELQSQLLCREKLKYAVIIDIYNPQKCLQANEEIPKVHLGVAIKYMKLWTVIIVFSSALAILACLAQCFERGKPRWRSNGYDSLNRVERDYLHTNGELTI